MQELLLGLHILGIALWLGTGMATPLWGAMARREHRQAASVIYAGLYRVALAVMLPGMLLTMGSGMAMLRLERLPLFALQPRWLFWMQVGGWLAFLASLLVVLPTAARMAQASARSGGQADLARYARRQAVAGAVVGLLLIAVTFTGVFRQG